MTDESWTPATRAVIAGRPPHEAGAAVSPFGGNDPGVYGRMNTATWRALEDAVGSLEGGTAVCYSSGMAAGAALFSLIRPGARLVMADSSYGSMLAMAQQLAASGRFDLDSVDITDTTTVIGAMRGADWLILESPTNPLLQVADLVTLGAAAAEHGVRIGIDNTFATPMLQNPLDFGASVVMHSGTKYLAGHSDVVAGVLIAREPDLIEAIRGYRGLHGAILGPMEASSDSRPAPASWPHGSTPIRRWPGCAIRGCPVTRDTNWPVARCAASEPCCRSTWLVASTRPRRW